MLHIELFCFSVTSIVIAPLSEVLFQHHSCFIYQPGDLRLESAAASLQPDVEYGKQK